MDRPGEHAVAVVHHNVSLVVRLHHRKEEHGLDVARHQHTPALAGQCCRSDPDLLPYFRADDSLGLVLILGSIRNGDVGVELVPEELSHQRDLDIVALPDVPDVRSSLGVTLPGLPRAGE